MLVLALSLFCADPAPLDMPRADAYLVEERERVWLEDRYDRMDLWVSQTVVGRWTDDDGRPFLLARLDVVAPAVDGHGTVSRAEQAQQCVPMPRVRANGGFPTPFRQAVSTLADTPLVDAKPRPPRQMPRGYKDVCYWQHPTNYSAVVCTFRPERTDDWYLAVWKLTEADDYASCMQAFEERFLRKEFLELPESVRAQPSLPDLKTSSRRLGPSFERELLRHDVRHSVAAYPNWHCSDSPEFVVVDDLPTRAPVVALSNEFARMRARYAATLPTSVDGSNVLCVARLYASRDEYLNALEIDGVTNLLWSAAYWSPLRRELVAYLPPDGVADLLKTVRHEAFHQYLSYATAMIETSPWLNEGYAQYFESPDDEDWDCGFPLTPEKLESLAALVPGLLQMNYRQFYDGTDFERRLKYRLAWSLAVFLERGADKVRFRPFAKLKGDYFDALFKTRDSLRATASAFGGEDRLKLFIAEWKRFWSER